MILGDPSGNHKDPSHNGITRMLKTWKRETEGKVKFKERSEGIRLLALKMEEGATCQGVRAAWRLEKGRKWVLQQEHSSTDTRDISPVGPFLDL